MNDTTDPIEAAAKVIDPLAFEPAGRCNPRGWEHSTPKEVARLIERRKAHALSVAKRIIAAYRDSEIEALRAEVVEKDARNLRLERENTLYGHALNKASIAFAKADTESVRRLLCGYDALSFLAQLRDDELTALRAKLADCQAVIRSRGHDGGCESNWCKHCDLAMHAHTFPISHPLDSRPCSEACGHDRTAGEKS